MTRDFDRKEKERQNYLLDHTSKRNLKEENAELQSKVTALELKVERLQKKLKKYKEKEKDEKEYNKVGITIRG